MSALLKHVRKVEDHGDHFVVTQLHYPQKDKEGSYKIAKRDLEPETVKVIGSMVTARKAADGDEIDFSAPTIAPPAAPSSVSMPDDDQDVPGFSSDTGQPGLVRALFVGPQDGPPDPNLAGPATPMGPPSPDQGPQQGPPLPGGLSSPVTKPGGFGKSLASVATGIATALTKPSGQGWSPPPSQPNAPVSMPQATPVQLAPTPQIQPGAMQPFQLSAPNAVSRLLMAGSLPSAGMPYGGIQHADGYAPMRKAADGDEGPPTPRLPADVVTSPTAADLAALRAMPVSTDAPIPSGPPLPNPPMAVSLVPDTSAAPTGAPPFDPNYTPIPGKPGFFTNEAGGTYQGDASGFRPATVLSTQQAPPLQIEPRPNPLSPPPPPPSVAVATPKMPTGAGAGFTYRPDLGDFDAGMEQQRRAVGEMEDNNRIAYRDAGLAIQAHQNFLGLIQKDFNERSKASEDEYNTLKTEVAQGKLDPTEWWTKNAAGETREGLAHAGHTILAAISMALGSFGSATTGSPNYAAQLIEGAINRNIEAQKINLSRKRDELNINQQQFDRMVRGLDWQAATQKQMAAMTLDKIANAQGAANAGPQAQLLSGQLATKGALEKKQLIAADIEDQARPHLIASTLRTEATTRAAQESTTELNRLRLRQESQQLQQQPVIQAMQRHILSGQPFDKSWLQERGMENLRERYVGDISGGRAVFVNDKEEKKDVLPQLHAADEVRAELKQARDFMKRTGGTWPSTADSATAEAMHGRMFARVNELAAQKRLTDKDIELIEEQIPSLKNWRTSMTAAKLDDIERAMDTGIASTLARQTNVH